MSNLCPCGSGLAFEMCCEPFLMGQAKPKTAVQLMRARYCAYAMGTIEYLYKTAGPRVRKVFDAENSKKWAESAKWSGIEILDTIGGGENDETGRVEFVAHYAMKEQEFNHHEMAEFAKVDGIWVFMDGKIFGTDPIRREQPKIGRNDLCPCGSGRKYKKCCRQGAETK
ncbi:MAG: YchJ family protein [Kiritimatiellaeota bacterium]|nr:YchJ family protein [Kiritimatiellota bacterium]